MRDSRPRTPMNHRAKFDASSFILGGEIVNCTNTHTHNYKKQTVSDILYPRFRRCVRLNFCRLSAPIDNRYHQRSAVWTTVLGRTCWRRLKVPTMWHLGMRPYTAIRSISSPPATRSPTSSAQRPPCDCPSHLLESTGMAGRLPDSANARSPAAEVNSFCFQGFQCGVLHKICKCAVRKTVQSFKKR